MSRENQLRWGFLGVGGAADRFAAALIGPAADSHGSVSHGDWADVLDDPCIDAVYVDVPVVVRAEWAIRAAGAGKHVLCEAPLGLNHPEAMAVAEAARRNGVALIDAGSWSWERQASGLVRLLGEQTVGAIRLISISLGSGALEEAETADRSRQNEAILLAGARCVSLAAGLVGAALGTRAVEPMEIKGIASHEGAGAGPMALASMVFRGDIGAQLTWGCEAVHGGEIQVIGDRGRLSLAGFDRGPAAIGPEFADRVTECVRRDRARQVDLAGSLLNLRTLDRWRESVDLAFDQEQPEALATTVAKRPLRRPGFDAEISRARLPWLDREVSKLLLGVVGEATAPRSAVMLDTFFERGGNFFDTAWQYEDGRAEERLGWWLETRGVRDEVAILDKGAHTPHCTPELLTLQHHESLERLRTDYVDLYMMHRDDVDIPVGEFVEVLNQHRKAGTMLAFGASNWTLPRVEEANRYASEHGLEGFSAISNQLSLARMEVPIWSGTLHAFDREWTDWLERNQAPLMAWSATARGFFVPGDVAFKADWGDRLPGEVHNHWNSEANFARRDRANELATRYGVAPVAIALAFVLHQRSPTFAVIGSRTIEELNISIEALGVDLSAAEVAWLRDGAVSASEA